MIPAIGMLIIDVTPCAVPRQAEALRYAQPPRPSRIRVSTSRREARRVCVAHDLPADRDRVWFQSPVPWGEMVNMMGRVSNRPLLKVRLRLTLRESA
jgi:hypothetical protein